MNLGKHYSKKLRGPFPRRGNSHAGTSRRCFVAEEFQTDRAKCLEWYESMLEIAERIGRGGVALDVGCGHGYVAGYLRMKGIEAFAFDVDPAVLKEHSVKGYFIRGDAMHLPIRNGALDLIIAFEVVEHLKDPNVTLHEFHKCLRSGGVLLLTTPTPKSRTANHPGHVSIRSRKAWVKALESVGFAVKIVTYKYPVHIFPSEALNKIVELL
jgi:SAM-dependent methyltransferase